MILLDLYTVAGPAITPMNSHVKVSGSAFVTLSTSSLTKASNSPLLRKPDLSLLKEWNTFAISSFYFEWAIFIIYLLYTNNYYIK